MRRLTLSTFALIIVMLVPVCLADTTWVPATTPTNIKNGNQPGNVGINVADPTAAKLQIGGSTTTVSGLQITPVLNGNVGATNIGLQAAPTCGVASATFMGVNAQVDQFGAVSGTVDTLIGLNAVARHFDSIPVSFAYGARYGVANRGTGTISNLYGTYIFDALNNGGGVVTNQYGLYIENQSVGLTKYALYSAGGQSYFNGNVGIGVPIPTEKLDVLGNINVSGNINAKYQDVAEWVPADSPIEAGTVVTLDLERSNRVQPSASAYDTGVAGVISAKPGLSLGEKTAEKVLVATTGRVKVKVDATKSPIRIGDLLVTSDKPGTAMRSEPIKVGGRSMHQPGTLIGKALEPMPSGTGEILVLLTLQ